VAPGPLNRCGGIAPTLATSCSQDRPNLEALLWAPSGRWASIPRRPIEEGPESAYNWFYLAFIVLTYVAAWKVYVKAGEEGWKAIIPIWNLFVLMRIVGRPWWWLILMLIPLVGLVIWIIVANDLSKSFGRGVGTTLGLIFLSSIFMLILGFGEARYQGPAGPVRPVTV
jgi:hypothetical protein